MELKESTLRYLDQVPRYQEESIEDLFAFCRTAREEDHQDSDDAEACQNLQYDGKYSAEVMPL
jgi:hypothetical protein